MNALGISNFIASTLTALVFVLCAPSAKAYFYQINSESLNNPNVKVLQSDLKLLVGYESEATHIFKNSRLAIGTYLLYQSAPNPSYFMRNGFIAHFRTHFLIPGFYIQIEHHEFQAKNSVSEAQNITSNRWNSENRYGLFYARYDEFSSKTSVDSYLESFYIPEVNKNEWLSVFRATVTYQYFEYPLNPIAELYLRESPANFGGKMRDLRIGAQWRPADFVSLKLMSNILPASETSTTGLLFQLNIFKEGAL